MKTIQIPRPAVHGALALAILLTGSESRAAGPVGVDIVAMPPGSGPVKGIMICSQVGLDTGASSR